MICSVMELSDEVTLFLCMTREDVMRMATILDGGGAICPALDMYALAQATGCARMITSLQLVVDEDEEAASARMQDIGQMLNLQIQHRGEIHPGGIIVPDPKGDRDVS